MADLSLDDIIQKKKVNQSFKKNLNTETKDRMKIFPKNIHPTLQTKFDARQKLKPKLLLDARDKIIQIKKSGAGDARNKIVQKQVQKGTFDARSLLQRQNKKVKPLIKESSNNLPVDSGQFNVQITRTLSNPIAKGRAHVQLTNEGIRITRPIPDTEVSLIGDSLQITKRAKTFESNLNSTLSSVPIIQIRNDKYRQPFPQSVQSLNYPLQVTAKPSISDPYQSNYNYGEHTFQSHHMYRDYDDPANNPASIADDLPKFQPSNKKSINTSVLKAIPYAGDLVKMQRAPPGAATVSQTNKQPMGKTIVQPAKLIPAGAKRKQPVAEEGSGRLTLGKNGGPGIDLVPTDSGVNKKPKTSAFNEFELEEEDKPNLISPLQGFRVMVTNLCSSVTQDDIIELFGAVGPLKKAKLIKSGTAEVVYVSRQDAVSAVEKYHSRELDGQPMNVKMTTPLAATVKKAVGDNDPDITGEALRLYKKGTGIGSLPEAPIEIPTIHRALFKTGQLGPSKSVKFTVKI